jgi:hypothetical protein
MFVRFRQVRHRLVVDLVQTRRAGGQVRSEHIARLGSTALPEPIAARERLRFWRELKERFRDLAARLGNSVTSDDRRAALTAIHRRIPKPTADEEQAVRIATARDDVAFWEMVRDDSSAGSAINQDRRRLIEGVEKQLADAGALGEMAERQIAAAQARFMKLTRGERVAGDDEPPAREAALALAELHESGHPTPPRLSRKQAAANAGLTPRQAQRAVALARLPQEQFDRMIESTPPASARRHSRRRGIMEGLAFAAAIFLAGMPASATEINDLLTAAHECSDAALRRYATTSPDPAPGLAEAAFNVCRQSWNAAADELIKKDDMRGFNFQAWLNRHEEARAYSRKAQEDMVRLEGWNAAWNEFKTGYILQATPIVFELRARAAGK